MNTLMKRELKVILHGQSIKFRLMKYIVIISIGILIYRWQGWDGVAYFLLFGALLGISGHLFLRWKTKGWKQNWWLFKTDR